MGLCVTGFCSWDFARKEDVVLEKEAVSRSDVQLVWVSNDTRDICIGFIPENAVQRGVRRRP